MIILSIETSCDETAVSIVEAIGEFPNAQYEILGNSLFSQIDIHREYGGVFPSLAKREHIATILPMLERALKASKLENEYAPELTDEETSTLRTLLSREGGLADQLLTFHRATGRPPIDLIAVTNGPGLEPALWVGLNFAKALSTLWQVPAIPVDHMEGHIFASIFDKHHLAPLIFPAMALLVSGGHTELILIQDWSHYEKVGLTRDDAVGEAFDKVARLLGLPYPGGPEISRLAAHARKNSLPPHTKLPAPMMTSGDLDFSFSGLKTAVRNVVHERSLSDDEKAALARDFEDVVVRVLIHKVRQAIDKYAAKSAILGGGVAANLHLRHAFASLDSPELYPDIKLFLPDPSLSTDNSIMIALAGHAHVASALKPDTFTDIRADGNQSL